MRHTFAAWALTLRMDPNRLVSLMGHGSKKMIYEVYGNYVEGLETDAGKILEYFGSDFKGLKENTTLPFTKNPSESTGESGEVMDVNYLFFIHQLMVEAAGVEPTVVLTVTGVCNGLPNVY